MTTLASPLAILAGDALAGAVFGSVLVLLPFTLVALLTVASFASPLLLAAALLQVHSPLPHSGYCYPLRRLPAISGDDAFEPRSAASNFVSGVVLADVAMPISSQWLALSSPLSCASDVIRIGSGDTGLWTALTAGIALAAFAVDFVVRRALPVVVFI